MFDPTALERKEELIVTVCYPVLPAFYGPNEFDDMEKVIRKDASEIRDVIFKASNYPAGVNAQFVTITPVDEADEDVWFQDLIVNVYYMEAQSL